MTLPVADHWFTATKIDADTTLILGSGCIDFCCSA